MSEIAEIPQEQPAISVGEFKNKNFKMERYRFGDSITRSNFTPWYVRGFALSHGDEAVQYGFLRWSSHKIGLDFQSLLQNFLKAGSAECFSDEEKELVVASYNAVREHKGEDKKSAKEDAADDLEGLVDPVVLFDFSIDTFVNHADDRQRYVNSILGDFDDLDTFDNLTKEEFMEWIEERRERSVNERKARKQEEQEY